MKINSLLGIAATTLFAVLACAAVFAQHQTNSNTQQTENVAGGVRTLASRQSPAEDIKDQQAKAGAPE